MKNAAMSGFYALNQPLLSYPQVGVPFDPRQQWQTTAPRAPQQFDPKKLPTYTPSLSLRERAITALDHIADHPGETLRQWLPTIVKCSLGGCLIGAAIGVGLGIPAGFAALKSGFALAHPWLASGLGISA